jgi:hypothetical protein
MPVDPKKPREVLVVHGAQTGRDDELDQHLLVEKLIDHHLDGIPLEFTTSIYPYEGMNDAARTKLNRVFGMLGNALLNEIPLSKLMLDGLDTAIDLFEDVVAALEGGSTADQIRAGLREHILRSYRAGVPLYIVAHSLGSVYAFDVINELIRTKPEGVFDREQRKTWPVQGLITLGSPLGLEMFRRRRKLQSLGVGRKWFRWFNYFSRTDPIVSGSFYGEPVPGYRIAERYSRARRGLGWIVHDRVVDAGTAWLPAHTAYWDHAPLGDDLVTFITS